MGAFQPTVHPHSTEVDKEFILPLRLSPPGRTCGEGKNPTSLSHSNNLNSQDPSPKTPETTKKKHSSLASLAPEAKDPNYREKKACSHRPLAPKLPEDGALSRPALPSTTSHGMKNQLLPLPSSAAVRLSEVGSVSVMVILWPLNKGTQVCTLQFILWAC